MAGIELNESFITDGISFLPQITDKDYTAHEYLFCHYDPKKSNFTKKIFVHNDHWKLHESGEVYNTLIDPAEENPIPESKLSTETMQLIDTYKTVLDNMSQEENTSE